MTGSRNTVSLGTYPDVGLAHARTRHAEARKLLAAGIDPGEKRKAERAATAERAANTFAAVGDELLQQRAKKLAAGSATRERRLLEKDLAPYVGKRPIADVTAPELLVALRKIEARGAVETAHRARMLAGQVFRYAIATGSAERNPAADLVGALSQPDETHFAGITDPAALPLLLRALHGYRGTPVVEAALKLTPLCSSVPASCAARAGRTWTWTPPNGATRQARPARRTSSCWRRRRSPSCVTCIPLTSAGEYVFSGARSIRKPIGENAVTAALRYMGFDGDTMTGHGFRAMARTILDEVLDFRPDYIEHQLAHAVRDPLGRTTTALRTCRSGGR